jgi:hypothetical protein
MKTLLKAADDAFEKIERRQVEKHT